MKQLPTRRVRPLYSFETVPGSDFSGMLATRSIADEIRSGDYLEDYRLIQALLNGRAPDFDVYDAASWSVVTALSEKPIANRSQAVDFPDFTRGKWKIRSPIEIMGC